MRAMRVSPALLLLIAFAFTLAIKVNAQSKLDLRAVTCAHSSTWGPNDAYPCSRAFDGDASTFSHTADQDTAHTLQFDLVIPHEISRIRVYRRSICCHRLYDIQIEVLDRLVGDIDDDFTLGSSGNSLHLSPVLNPGNTDPDAPAPEANFGVYFFVEVVYDPPVIGSFVRITKDTELSSHILQPSEIEVYGVAANIGTALCQGDQACVDSCQEAGHGGCSSCVAAYGNCVWCADIDNEGLGTCVSAGVDSTCGQGYLTGWAPADHLCPADPLDTPTPKGKNVPAEAAEAPIRAYNTNFCDFEGGKTFLDKWATLPFLGLATKFGVDSCYRANYWGSSMILEENGNSRYVDARTRTSLEQEIISNCRTDANPFASEFGMQCLYAMIDASCTDACPAYGELSGNPCWDWDELYRLCAPWTEGPTGRNDPPFEKDPLNNGCPLDPNNFRVASSTAIDCQSDHTHLPHTDYYESFFKVQANEPLFLDD